MKKKLVLKKQTVQNLNRGDMTQLKGGVANPTCHYPTLAYWECAGIDPTAWTCDGANTCMCMSIWPV